MSRFGATILDASGPRLTHEEKAFFREADPFGFILFARNVERPDQVRALCAEMREAVGREAVITIDQEGGRVQRLRSPDWTEWRSPLEEVKRAGRSLRDAMWCSCAMPIWTRGARWPRRRALCRKRHKPARTGRLRCAKRLCRLTFRP